MYGKASRRRLTKQTKTSQAGKGMSGGKRSGKGVGECL